MEGLAKLKNVTADLYACNTETAENDRKMAVLQQNQLLKGKFSKFFN